MTSNPSPLLPNGTLTPVPTAPPNPPPPTPNEPGEAGLIPGNPPILPIANPGEPKLDPPELPHPGATSKAPLLCITATLAFNRGSANFPCPRPAPSSFAPPPGANPVFGNVQPSPRPMSKLSLAPPVRDRRAESTYTGSGQPERATMYGTPPAAPGGVPARPPDIPETCVAELA